MSIVWNSCRYDVVVPAKVLLGGLGFILRWVHVIPVEQIRRSWSGPERASTALGVKLCLIPSVVAQGRCRSRLQDENRDESRVTHQSSHTLQDGCFL